MGDEGFDNELQKIPCALQPTVPFGEPNSEIDLYSGTLVLQQGGRAAALENGRVFLQWTPAAKVRFSAPNNTQAFELRDAKLFVDRDEVDASITNLSLFSGPIQGTLWNPAAIGSGGAGRVLFQVTNFHGFNGRPIRNDSSVWAGRLELSTANWRITLDQRPDCQLVEKALKASGGYAFTHTGQIAKAKSSSISQAETARLAEDLFWFLSFCRGIWSGPVLLFGLRSGKPTWKRWYLPKVAPYKAVYSWFPCNDRGSLGHLSSAFDSFLELRRSAVWNQPIANAIHWYVEANSSAGGVEGGFILTQAALELLSWVHLVEDPRAATLSSTKFDPINAAEKLRLLFQSLQVPLEIPGQLSAARQAASGLNVSDVPGALVAVRNALIHPKRTKRKALGALGSKARFELLHCGLRSLEFSILRLIGYQGLHYDRLIHAEPATL